MPTKAKTDESRKATGPHPCACRRFTYTDDTGEQNTGCNRTVSARRLFAPGHDAKLKTFLIKAGVARKPVVVTNEDGSSATFQRPWDAADRVGAFGYMVRKSVEARIGTTPAPAPRRSRRTAAA